MKIYCNDCCPPNCDCQCHGRFKDPLPPEPGGKFKVGDLVELHDTYGMQYVRIVEDRGCIGKNSRRIYAINIHGRVFEVPESALAKIC